MRIPVVLATAHVEVGGDGQLLVDVDGEPFAADRHLDRDDLSTVLDQITTTLGTAVRVEVHEHDGTTYADIATPPDPDHAADVPEPVQPVEPVPMPGLTGAGFQPGEEVAIAYVVARYTADANGRAHLQLPPVLAAANRNRLVLLGMTSQITTAMEPR
ncbi:hypothetical protein [Nocardioides sp. W7]|uniref:hypothetical protein n=1 Tax=Nocardioides sp. W7 TaxID=2931390 RepID=UPI001FD485D0|nr:hypothetical protein [Nocardioides sp. W7]